MAEFTLKIRRIETWEEEVTVEADTLEEAVAQTNATLVEEGWAHFFGDEDGDYIDCESFVQLPESAEDDDDDEAGDDVCDICMRSGVAVYRTTLDGDTVCESQDCQDAADEQDAAYKLEHPDEDEDEEDE